MIGNTVNMDPGYANGFETDFFDVEAAVMPMDALADMGSMDMGDDAMDDDAMYDDAMDDDAMDDDGHEGHSGFMVVREAGEEARSTFTVPDGRAGSLECRPPPGRWDGGWDGDFWPLGDQRQTIVTST